MTVMAVLVEYPWIAMIVAALCAALWLWRRRRIAGIAAAVWGFYAVYEYLMKLRVLCSGECNIRIDLLLIYPALAVLTVVAVIASLMPARGSGRRSEEVI
jgi:hypothetical protein